MRLLPALCSVVAVLGMAAPAHADPPGNDASFLDALKNAGITYQSPEGAVANGKAVCGMLDDGKSGADIVTQLRQLNPNFPQQEAAKFVMLASVAYCPKYLQVASDSK